MQRFTLLAGGIRRNVFFCKHSDERFLDIIQRMTEERLVRVRFTVGQNGSDQLSTGCSNASISADLNTPTNRNQQLYVEVVTTVPSSAEKTTTATQPKERISPPSPPAAVSSSASDNAVNAQSPTGIESAKRTSKGKKGAGKGSECKLVITKQLPLKRTASPVVPLTANNSHTQELLNEYKEQRRRFERRVEQLEDQLRDARAELVRAMEAETQRTNAMIFKLLESKGKDS